MPKALLDELEEIDNALTGGDATPEQETRGLEIVGICNNAPAVLQQIQTLEDEITLEKRLRKEAEKRVLIANRKHFAYRDIQAIYSRLKAEAEHDAQAPVDEHYREVLYLNRELRTALQACLCFAEQELELRLPSADPEYIEYAQKPVDTARAAIAKVDGGAHG
jgi:hypothetical protein